VKQQPEPERPQARDPNVGLCFDCLNARRVKSERGSVFYLCRLSATDSKFEKYPRIPVIQCPGYKPGDTEKSD
jgi:hypothetical protein